MSSSKHVHIPAYWAKLEREVLKEKPDPALVDLDGLIKWVIECEIGDEDIVHKYVKIVRPYYFFRCLFPILPNDFLSREIFKVFLQFLIAIYRCDDVMEQDCNLDDMQKICSAYEWLDEKLCASFPQLPSVKDIQVSLEFLAETKLIAPVTLCMDFVNRVISLLLKHGDVLKEVILEFRRRLSNTLLVYLQSVESEKKMTAEDTENETLWRRIFGGGPLIFLPFVEISSFSLGKTKEHIPTITQLYVVSSLCCVVVNDIYSYRRETAESLVYCDSIIKLWLHKKEIVSVPEAVARITQILNTIMQYMHKMIEDAKVEYPNSPEYHVLVDYIARATVGWLFIHDQCSPRYQDTPWRLSLCDIEENELQEFLANKDHYGLGVVNQFLEKSNSKAKKVIDALRGITAVQGKLINESY